MGPGKIDFEACKIKGVVFHEGIPDHDALVQWFPEGHGVLVLDDLMDEGSRVINACWIYSPNIRIIKG